MIAERRADGALVPNLDVDVDTVPDVPPDQGCDLVRFHPAFASCQRCPLPACRYELPGGAARAVAVALGVDRLDGAGLSTAEMAAELAISRRSVSRAKRLLSAAWEVAS